MSSPRHPLSMSSQYFSSLVCFEAISYPVSQYHLLYLSGRKPAPNPWGPRSLTGRTCQVRKVAASSLLLCSCGEEQATLSKDRTWPRRANLLGKHLMVSLKCEPCASTKSNELLVFGATAAALISSTTSSMLRTAKLILFHLTKAKKKKRKGLLSVLILQEDLPVQEKFCHFPKPVM